MTGVSADRLLNMEGHIQRNTFRIDTLENSQKQQSQQYSALRDEMIRMDENVKGVRSQAQAHNETQTKAMANLEGFVQRGLDEQYKVMSRIITALGIDEDIHAAASLRKNLQRLADGNSSKEKDMRAIRNWVIAAVLSIFGFLIVAGLQKFIGV